MLLSTGLNLTAWSDHTAGFNSASQSTVVQQVEPKKKEATQFLCCGVFFSSTFTSNYMQFQNTNLQVKIQDELNKLK